MTENFTRPLGILGLEFAIAPGVAPPPAREGSLFHPVSFDIPTISETVTGAWAENVIRGDPALEPAFIAAARRLEERGALAITADCGYSLRHQAAVAASVKVPVALSSLLLAPSLLRQLPKSAKLAVIAADSTQLSHDLLGIDDTDRARVVIGGIEGGTFWRNEMEKPSPVTEMADIATEVDACIRELLQQNTEIAAILFECTGFALVTKEIRRTTPLPIYDILSLNRMVIASLK